MRLGRPREFLGWSVSYENDGSIHASQPSLLKATPANADMTTINSRRTPYPNNGIIPPPHGVIMRPEVQKRHLQFFGDLRYLLTVLGQFWLT